MNLTYIFELLKFSHKLGERVVALYPRDCLHRLRSADAIAVQKRKTGPYGPTN